MILIVHIIIALTTVIASILSVVKPRADIINGSRYGVVATAVSGILLGLTAKVSIGHLCASGIAVVGFCSVMIMIASKKLSSVKI